jgi:hypothetical protein
MSGDKLSEITGQLREIKSGTLTELGLRMGQMHDRQNRQEAFLAQALTEIKEGKLETKEHMADIALGHEKKVRECLKHMSDRFDKKIDDIMNQAFPSGDLHGHKKYHNEKNEWLENRNAFFREVLSHIAKAGILSGIFVIGVALWNWLVMEIKRGG